MPNKGCHIPGKGCHIPSRGCDIPNRGCYIPSRGCYIRTRAGILARCLQNQRKIWFWVGLISQCKNVCPGEWNSDPSGGPSLAWGVPNCATIQNFRIFIKKMVLCTGFTALKPLKNTLKIIFTACMAAKFP